MLTRVSKLRVGTSSEACYVVGRAKAGRPSASSARTSRSVRSRQVGSDTKRAHTDGLPTTFPRGDSEAANLGASRPQGLLGGNAHLLITLRTSSTGPTLNSGKERASSPS